MTVRRPNEILDDGLVAGLRDCGDGFEKGEKFIPEMLMSSESMKKAMEVLKPLLLEGSGGRKFRKGSAGDCRG